MRANLIVIRLMFGVFVTAAIIFATATGASAQQAAVAITVKGHQFQPTEVHAPANKQLALHVKNSIPRRWSSKAFRFGLKRSSPPVVKASSTSARLRPAATNSSTISTSRRAVL
jgi:Cupredoxin-like domain